MSLGLSTLAQDGLTPSNLGTDIPPTLAPAPAPDISPAADAPTASDEAASPRASSTPSSSYRIISLGVWSQLVLAVVPAEALMPTMLVQEHKDKTITHTLSAKVVSHDGNFPDSLTGYKSIKLLIIRHELYKLQFKLCFSLASSPIHLVGVLGDGTHERNSQKTSNSL
ncbi:hypothetical protein CK203_045955 [Vitis vinifera]|uniref:Uncharacterized protein n=1 Tax=Vitis vinifera TaxID=29760 RepID=A0A438I4W7_VITVI|nr:hypothetical protein CK203_045955 [Vitis vinifera]